MSRTRRSVFGCGIGGGDLRVSMGMWLTTIPHKLRVKTSTRRKASSGNRTSPRIDIIVTAVKYQVLKSYDLSTTRPHTRNLTVR